MKHRWKNNNLEQEFSTLAPEVLCPTEFSSNPNQTHLNKHITVFRKWWKMSLIKVGGKLCRKVDLEGHSRAQQDLS